MTNNPELAPGDLIAKIKASGPTVFKPNAARDRHKARQAAWGNQNPLVENRLAKAKEALIRRALKGLIKCCSILLKITFNGSRR